MCKYNFITRYFLVQFIKINVLSRESPPISQTKQTISPHHAPCVPFFGLWIQRSSSFSAVFEEKTNTVSLTVWNPYYGYFVSMYLRHNLLVGQAQYVQTPETHGILFDNRQRSLMSGHLKQALLLCRCHLDTQTHFVKYYDL